MSFFIAPITIKLGRDDIERALFDYVCKSLGADNGEIELTKAEVSGKAATLTVIRKNTGGKKNAGD